MTSPRLLSAWGIKNPKDDAGMSPLAIRWNRHQPCGAQFPAALALYQRTIQAETRNLSGFYRAFASPCLSAWQLVKIERKI